MKIFSRRLQSLREELPTKLATFAVKPFEFTIASAFSITGSTIAPFLFV